MEHWSKEKNLNIARDGLIFSSEKKCTRYKMDECQKIMLSQRNQMQKTA